MLNRILQNLNVYLGSDYNEPVLIILVSKVISLVKFYRNYPDTYTKEMIDSDIEKYEMKIFDISLSAFNRMGIEGEESHLENGTSTKLVSDEKLYSFITPIARVV